MNLGYKQKFPDGTPTLFREKLIIGSMKMKDVAINHDTYKLMNGVYVNLHPKLHSIRTDEKDRWRAGVTVHHLYNSRTPSRENFMTSTCISTQKIMIIETPQIVTDFRGNPRQAGRMRSILVDGKILKPPQMYQLAINDGFNNLEHFFSWFPDKLCRQDYSLHNFNLLMMTPLEIRTQAFDELHPYPEYQEGKPLFLKAANIVQGITNNHRTGVELFLEDEQGNKYFTATTARLLLNGLGGAIRGTMERFNDDPYQP